MIGAGLPRTGTMTLKSALETLLGAPCHHMSEVFGRIETDPPAFLAAARGERVLGRAHEHEGLAPEDGLRERPEVVRGRDERDVEVALAHAREEVVRAGLGELDLDLGVAAVEALEQGGDVEDPEALLGPDAQRAGQGARRPHDRVATGGGLREHGPCVRQQREPGLGGLDAAGRAREEARAELLLQAPDRGGEPGLRDPDELRGARELALVREGDEVLHLAQIH